MRLASLAGTPCPRPRLHLRQQLGRVTEAMNDVEEDFALVREEACHDGLLERRVHPRGVPPELALVEPPEDAVGAHDRGVDERGLQVEEQAAAGEAQVDPPQGVHDALERQSSKRVREEGDVEGCRRLVELQSAPDLESDARGQVGGHRAPGPDDRLLAGVDRRDGTGGRRVAEGEAAVAAADLEDPRTVESGDLPQRRRLDAWVDDVSLEPHRCRSHAAESATVEAGPREAPLGLTRRDVVRLLVVDESTVSRWESGRRRPPAGYRERLLTFLGAPRG